MIDLAIGLVIGLSFSQIVKSLVGDVLMPIIAVVSGDTGFTQRFTQLTGEGAPNLEAAREAGPTLAWGNVLTVSIDFAIVAFILFLIVKAINAAKRKEEKTPKPETQSKEQILLTEIRDLLKYSGK